MRFLHFVILCCFSGVHLKTFKVLKMSGCVGGDVSIRCSDGWTTDNSSELNNLYFWKGLCSRGNILIQSERKTPIVTRGRYRLEEHREHGVFYVTIKKLKRADAGKYCCGVEKTLETLYQDISLQVNALSVLPGSSRSTTSTLQTRAEALSHGSFRSSTEPAALIVPATEKKNQQAATSLTDTTVVIIVSVSLALLVCAVIPLIFYGHWRGNEVSQNSQEENKGETAVRLHLEEEADREPSAQDVSQYAAIYQALDPKALD